MITLNELERILAVSKENDPLRMQLEKLKQTWSLVDPEYISLLNEKASLAEEYEQLMDRIGKIKIRTMAIDNQIDNIDYESATKSTPGPPLISGAQPLTVKKAYAVQQYTKTASPTWSSARDDELYKQLTEDYFKDIDNDN